MYAQLAFLVKPDLALTDDAAAAYFIEYLEQLLCELALPSRLSQVGIAEHHLELLADEAMKQERLLVNNPRVLQRSDALAIYQSAF